MSEAIALSEEPSRGSAGNSGCPLSQPADGRKAPMFTLTLRINPSLGKIPEDIDSIVLCASVTGVKKCEEYPGETRHINVAQTLRLATLMIERGAFVVFLSGILVFSSSAMNRRANRTSQIPPLNTAGRRPKSRSAFCLCRPGQRSCDWQKLSHLNCLSSVNGSVICVKGALFIPTPISPFLPLRLISPPGKS